MAAYFIQGDPGLVRELTQAERIRCLDTLYRAAIDARLAYGGIPVLNEQFDRLVETIERCMDLAGVVEMAVDGR